MVLRTHVLFVKAFFACVIAFGLAFICVNLLIKPVIREDGLAVYMSAGFVQDMLNAELRGKNIDELSNYISRLNDSFLHNAQIATVSDLLNPDAAQKYGIYLFPHEKLKLHSKTAFWTGKPMKYLGISAPKNEHTPPKHSYSNTVLNGGSVYWNVSSYLYNSSPGLSFAELIRFTHGILDNHSFFQKSFFERRNTFIFLPIADTPYVIFSRRPVPPSPEIPVSAVILTTFNILIIILITVLLIVVPILRRLRRIEESCLRVSQGDYKSRCNDTSHDSIGALARHIDDMTASIERHLNQQKSLLQAVSHELRTPLSRIRFTIEMLDIPEDDEKSMSRIDSIDEDLTEIDNLLKELGYFNYVDAGKGRQHFETNALKDLIEMTLHQRSHALEQFHVAIEGMENDMSIEADPTAFKRVIGNLLSNASRYAKEKIEIHIAYSDDHQNILIAVDDDGPGIPEDKRAAVFEPFVCLEKSRSKSMTGCGLGLAIADRIMKVHRGSIEVQVSALGGARMLTSWPIQQDKPL